MKTKKSPMRRCLGCGESKPKRDLVRIVRNSEGVFFIDKTGKAPGRGAYICANRECFAKARKSHGIERSFKMKVAPLLYDTLGDQLFAADGKQGVIEGKTP